MTLRLHGPNPFAVIARAFELQNVRKEHEAAMADRSNAA
jgi:hypothetical protein